MSSAVLKTTAKILAHHSNTRNKTADTIGGCAGDPGRDDYEKSYRDHRRKASGADRKERPDMTINKGEKQ
jgi:hypothetical protein